MLRRNRVLLTLLIVLLNCPSLPGSRSVQAGETDFARDVLPILSNKCFVCHGPDAAEIDPDMLRLDSQEGATEDRGGYKAVDQTAPSESQLLHRIHSTDDPMPPADAEKQLTPRETEILTAWIEEGGTYAKHWAFVPPTRPAVPPAPPGTHPIDAFIGRQLATRGVDFAPEAAPSVLARRLALVLTGLPPEPKSLSGWIDDPEPGDWETYTEGLLTSPKFGEHQARYWLDAVRYGDTHGLHLDNRRGIYPYRDWVVRAFNRNMPLDDFIVWQLAGDLLPQPNLSQRVATGFVRMNPTTAEGGAIPEEFQAKNNFDRTETLGTVLLGMSLTCARCHTHKYDPITQREYYQLLAFFNNTAEHSMDGNKYDYVPVVSAPQDQAAWDQWEQHQAAVRQVIQEAQRLSGAQNSSREQLDSGDPADALRMIADEQSPFQGQDIQQRANRLLQEREELQKGFTTTLVAEELAQPRETRLLRRGEYDLPVGEPLQPETPAAMGLLPTDYPRNRLGLAKWLTSDDHPLVARVVVNRIWQQVFGYAIVRTPEDFGLQGEQPTHPELLDWLAVELQESHWNLRHMIRIMVSSRTFRQRSAWRDDLNDPENRYFGRASAYRMDAEMVRDVALWSSGLLDPHMGGEGVKPYQPAGMWKAMAHPGSNTKQYERDKGKRLYRRSLYVYWKRTSPHPMMTLFDAPNRESACVRRSRTTTSLQSLGLLNETQRIEMSRGLAEELLQAADSDEGRIELLYRRLTCRAPSRDELQTCHALLEQQRARFAAAPGDADQLNSIGEYQCPDSLDPIELAALSQVCTVVLASDAALMIY